MVFRLCEKENLNRRAFDAQERRRQTRRRMILSVTLFSLAFSSSWVVLIALHAGISLWLGIFSLLGSILAGSKAISYYTLEPEQLHLSRRLKPAPVKSGYRSGSWVGRSVLPVALILKS